MSLSTPTVSSQGRACVLSRPLRSREAFSLIEVLVATTLLIMIVVTVGMVFRQSMLSWDSGIQRADGSMVVRSVIGAIERDLRSAVDGRAFPGINLGGKAMQIAAGSAKFVALLPAEGGSREPYLIELTGGNQVTRKASPLIYRDGTWSAGTPVPPTGTTLLFPDSGASFQTTVTYEAWPTAAEFPLWVNVEAELVNTENFSGVSARSRGRDGKPNTKDDIVIR